VKVRTIWFKLNVIYIAALAVSLALYSGFLYFGLSRSLHYGLDQELRKKATHINNILGSYLNILGRDRKSFIFSVKDIISEEGEHPHANKIEKLEELWSKQERVLELGKDYINILNSKGESITHSGPYQIMPTPAPLRDIQPVLKGATVIRDTLIGNKRLRIITTPIPFAMKESYVLQVGVSLEAVDEALRKRMVFTGFSVLIIVASASVLNQFFSARILRPVLQIATMAKNLDYKKLNQRISTRYPDEEMQNLVDSFNDMISRLDRSFKYITQFSSHVSHELKTPLTIVKGESELALKRVQEPQEYYRVIQNNLEEVERMIKIVDDLLLLTRLDYQPEVFKFEELDLVEFFKEMEEPVKVLASDKKINIHFDLPRGFMPTRGAKVHLRRLFFNLIHNAVKFTPPGGRINLALKREGKRAVVTVTDTGAGIPANVLPKIFEQFFHFDRADLEPVSGTGLGLSIAQSIAKIHQGRIDVQSQTGQGTTFTVRLPL